MTFPLFGASQTVHKWILTVGGTESSEVVVKSVHIRQSVLVFWSLLGWKIIGESHSSLTLNVKDLRKKKKKL